MIRNIAEKILNAYNSTKIKSQINTVHSFNVGSPENESPWQENISSAKAEQTDLKSFVEILSV
jgi:hypothetical protein